MKCDFNCVNCQINDICNYDKAEVKSIPQKTFSLFKGNFEADDYFFESNDESLLDFDFIKDIIAEKLYYESDIVIFAQNCLPCCVEIAVYCLENNISLKFEYRNGDEVYEQII